MTFGQKCRYFRQQKKLTQQEVAESAGISKRTYLYYEQGSKMPRRRETVKKLADIFGVDMNRLVVEDDERFLELINGVTAEDRIAALMKSVSSLLDDESIDGNTKRSFIESLNALCLNAKGLSGISDGNGIE